MRSILLFLALTSSAMIGGALFGQYVLRWYPCELCIFQRIPHIAIILLGLGGFLLKPSEKIQKILLGLCLLMLLITAGIAAYHAGVEADIFKGPQGCVADVSKPMTIEELRAQIAGAPLVSCKQAMAYIFGLSLAVWNMVISLALVFSTVLWLKRKK